MTGEIAVSGQLGLKDTRPSESQKQQTLPETGIKYYTVKQQNILPTTGETVQAGIVLSGLLCLILLLIVRCLQKDRVLD